LQQFVITLKHFTRAAKQSFVADPNDRRIIQTEEKITRFTELLNRTRRHKQSIEWHVRQNTEKCDESLKQ